MVKEEHEKSVPNREKKRMKFWDGKKRHKVIWWCVVGMSALMMVSAHAVPRPGPPAHANARQWFWASVQPLYG